VRSGRPVRGCLRCSPAISLRSPPRRYATSKPTSISDSPPNPGSYHTICSSSRVISWLPANPPLLTHIQLSDYRLPWTRSPAYRARLAHLRTTAC
jgi:hypothetical protein